MSAALAYDLPPGPPRAPMNPRRRRLGAIVIIVVAVVAAYWRSTTVPFFFDDRPGIERNDSIRHLSVQALQPPNSAAGAAGRPMVNVTLAANYAVGGLNPAGYHAVNVAFHLATALLLFGVMSRTLRRTHRFRPTAESLAAAMALLWAIHPLTSESVVCTIQRNELLASLFLLATLYAFIRSIEPGARARPWQTVSILSCFLGIASKETMVVAPLIVLLYDRTFATGAFRPAWRARAGYYASLAATWLLLVYLVLGYHQRAGTVGFGLGTSPWQYLVTQCHALVLYIKLALWPHPLVVDYGFELSHGLSAVWPEAVLIAAALGATVCALWRRPAWGFGPACFFILLAPSSSIVPLTTQTIAEHRMYLPLAAIVAALVLGLAMVVRRRMGLVCCIVLPGVALTAKRVETYQSEYSIWTDTIGHRPGNARAWSSLARVLVRENRWSDAATHYARAVALRPDYADTQNDYANVLLHLGRSGEALAHYRTAHLLKPEDNDIQLNYADALTQTGDAAGALENARAVTARDPRNVRALNSVGDSWLKQNRPADALAAFTTALGVDPASAVAHNNVAVALMNLGRYAEAVPHYEAALRHMGQSAVIHHNLALALDGAGRLAEAAREETAALRLDPTLARAREHLADLDARQRSAP